MRKLMRFPAALAAAALSLAACATRPTPPSCPPGQEALRTAQLFFGRPGAPGPSDADFRKFVDEVMTPRFPDGLTVLDGGARWLGAENRQFREASKVVQIVLPASSHAERRIAAARAAYAARFHEEPLVVITPASCVKF
jgi:hypothetical protein